MIGYRRCCLSELVDHDHTGLLTELLLASKGIGPTTCARAAAARLTPDIVARRYLKLHEHIRTSTR